MSDRERPFSSGEERLCWEADNCDRCRLSEQYGVCAIQTAISEAAIDDGTLSAEMAARMGYPAQAWSPEGLPYLTWDCPERELVAQRSAAGEAEMERWVVVDVLL